MKVHLIRMGITIGLFGTAIATAQDTPKLATYVGSYEQANVDAPMVVLLPLIDTGVSTSGDYERYFEEDGVRYHHILDPSTGDSARATQSVTILGKDATFTDALSTSVFVLGPVEGLKLIDRLPGVDAIVIDAEGVMRYSEELKELRH